MRSKLSKIFERLISRYIKKYSSPFYSEIFRLIISEWLIRLICCFLRFLYYSMPFFADSQRRYIIHVIDHLYSLFLLERPPADWSHSYRDINFVRVILIFTCGSLFLNGVFFFFLVF